MGLRIGLILSAALSVAEARESWLKNLAYDGPFAFQNVIPTAISADGRVVVGFDDVARMAFRWRSADGLTHLAGTYDWTIRPRLVTNDGNTVVGVFGQFGVPGFQVGGVDAFLWSSSGAYQVLPSFTNPVATPAGEVIVGSYLPEGHKVAQLARYSAGAYQILYSDSAHSYTPAAISADGSVITGSYRVPAQFPERGFRWSANGGLVDLGSLGGNVYPYAMTWDGQVIAGGAADATGSQRAFRWTSSTGIQKIPTGNDDYAAATAISTDGKVIYGLHGYGLATASFVWSNELGFRDIVMKGSEELSTQVRGVTADGQYAVGAATVAVDNFPEEKAFLRTPDGKLIDLDLLFSLWEMRDPYAQTMASAEVVAREGNALMIGGRGWLARVDLTELAAATSAPAIVSSPVSQAVKYHDTVTLSVVASNTVVYRWTRNGRVIAESLEPTLRISTAADRDAGTYQVTAIGPGGETTSAPFVLSIAGGPIYKLSNLSTRAYVGTGADVLIAGFIISGDVPRKVLIRASGPSLAQFGIDGFLADPRLSIHDAQREIAANEDWGSTVDAKQAMIDAMRKVNAFPWLNGSKDAGIVLTLPPGGYTAIVSGISDTVGTALIEIFDLDGLGGSSRLINLSSRSSVRTGENVQIAGFVVAAEDATVSTKVVVRASGPALTKYGVPGVLADPVLEIHDGSRVIASNDDWPAFYREEFRKAGVDNWDANSKDAAVVLSLRPGAYTAIVSGKNGGTGVALVEVIDLLETE